MKLQAIMTGGLGQTLRTSFFASLLPLLASGQLQAADASALRVRIEVDTKTVLSKISPDFIGLGYETSAAAQSNYFSANNHTLIQLYRNLSPQGLIRIGGNISDHTQYVPAGPPAVHTEKQVTIINRSNLVDLAGFAQATGWKVMWGLNLGTGSKTAAVTEAVAVDGVLGQQIQSFEIGNEVDLRGGYDGKYHDYTSYYSNYLAYKAVIRAALPQAAFSGPDVAGNLAWLIDFANAEAKDVKLLKHHYYRTGARTPEATIAYLLETDDAWNRKLKLLQDLAQAEGVSYRINEVNSFFGGGKPGVSDTFASALWCLDYMFGLATYGCNGVNMETDINQLGWISHYSPIVHEPMGKCSARPEYYAMLAFALAGKGDLLKLTLEKNNLNLSAYATMDESGLLWLTVVNKDLAQDGELEVILPTGYTMAEAFRLKAPAVESQEHITFAGAEVSPDGKFTPGLAEAVTVKAGAALLLVPHASAALVRLRRD